MLEAGLILSAVLLAYGLGLALGRDRERARWAGLIPGIDDPRRLRWWTDVQRYRNDVSPGRRGEDP